MLGIKELILFYNNDVNNHNSERWVEDYYSPQLRRAIDVLDVLEKWVMTNRKPKKIMHDHGEQDPYTLLSITT